MLAAQPRLLVAYVTGLVLTAVSLGVALVVMGYGLESPLVVLGLAAATAVAERWSVPISATTDLTIYLLPTVFAAVVFIAVLVCMWQTHSVLRQARREASEADERLRSELAAAAERSARELTLAAVALIAQPRAFRTPVQFFGLPYVRAAAGEAERLEAHRLERDVAREHHQVGP